MMKQYAFPSAVPSRLAQACHIVHHRGCLQTYAWQQTPVTHEVDQETPARHAGYRAEYGID
jgi:hypothetical protein